MKPLYGAAYTAFFYLFLLKKMKKRTQKGNFYFIKGGFYKKICTFVAKYPSLKKRRMDIARQRPPANRQKYIRTPS